MANNKDGYQARIDQLEQYQKRKDHQIECELENCVIKALDALGRYKFWMFGYWAAIWVHLNHLHPIVGGRGNPFRDLVKLAKKMKGGGFGQSSTKG
jgi:hypothetical protein